MLLSLQWLKEFVAIPKHVSPQKLGELLTMHTVEVEEVIEQGRDLENVVVGEVQAVRPHPNADRLRIAVVRAGTKKYNVVCGGSNLYEGMLVAFAKVGAQVRWHGTGDLVTLEPAEIRGEQSEGMICAAVELGLGELFPAEGEKEVIDLQQVATSKQVGTPLATVLGLDDVVYDIDNKSMTHRPDLWSHYGMARDIAAFLSTAVRPLPHAPLPRPRSGAERLQVTVSDNKLCPRYMAVRIGGLAVRPSPAWMQKRLRACGMRPINNIVDTTNYIMLETGQPTHAFDANKLGATIAVRSAKKGETIVTLDGKKRKLNETMLVIADGAKPVAIAGVMGGAESEVDEQTTDIVLEAATFDAVSVRTTAQTLGLRTEASARFEKSLDPALPEVAIQRIYALLKESCPAAVITTAVVDVKKALSKPKAIAVDYAWLQARLGEPVSAQESKDILKRLGFAVTGTAKTLSVTPPSWRATKDITIPEDILEEVARIRGFEHIAPSYPLVPMRAPQDNAVQRFVRHLKRTIALAGGFHETISSVFVNEEQLAKWHSSADDHIRIANPISADCTVLRHSLVPNIIEQVIANQRTYTSIRLFEFGRIFMRGKSGYALGGGQSGTLPRQPMHVAMACNGADESEAFFTLKGVLEMMGEAMRVTVTCRPASGDAPAWARNEMYATVTVHGTAVGYLTVVGTQTAKAIGLKTPSAVAELAVEELFALAQARGEAQYAPKPQYPAVRRDLAFVVDEKIVYNEIVNTIRAASDAVEEVELFDLYRGEKVGEGNKSVAVHVTLRDAGKTLSSEDADTRLQTIVRALEQQLKAKLRDF